MGICCCFHALSLNSSRASLSQMIIREDFLDDLHIVKVTAFFKSEDYQTQVLGTGIMIGFKYVFTAAHLLYSQKDKKYLDWAKVQLTINNKSEFVVSPQNIFIPNKFQNSDNHFPQINQYDFGLLQLRGKMAKPSINEQDSKPLYLQFNKLITKIKDKRDHVLVLGFGLYASYKEKIYSSQKTKQQNKLQLRLLAGTGTFQKQNQLLRYRINTSEGMSGGPILQYLDGRLIFLGIHLGSNAAPLTNDQLLKKVRRGPTQSNKQQCNIGLSAQCFASWVYQIVGNPYVIHADIFKFAKLQQMLLGLQIEQQIVKQRLIMEEKQQSQLILVEIEDKQPDTMPQSEFISSQNYQSQQLSGKKTEVETNPTKTPMQSNSNIQPALHEPILGKNSHDSIKKLQGEVVFPVGLAQKYLSAQQQSVQLGFEPKRFIMVEQEAHSYCQRCQIY